MRTTKGRLAASVAAVLLLELGGCRDVSGPQAGSDGAFAAAESNTTVSVIPMDFTDFVSCTGENVHWTGTVRVVVHGTTNRGVVLPPDAFQHAVDVESVKLTGVGETNGGSYRLSSNFLFAGQAEDPVNPYPAVVRITLRVQIIGPAGGVVGVTTFTFTLAINGTGETVVEKANFADECR